MKKSLSVILLLFIVLLVLPLGAFSITSSAATSGTTGDCAWTLDGTVLTISGKGEMSYYYFSSPAPWGTNVTNVIIENGVTNIGNYAFYGCSSLTSITIPNSVTSIGDSAVYGCSALTSITITDSVTNIGNSAFYGCSALTSITITDSVANIGNSAFYGCSSLKKVNITDLASWCNIDFDDYDSNPLYYAENLYINGTLLTELNIPNTITSINDYAFYNYSLLISITIPDSVNSIGTNAFYNTGYYDNSSNWKNNVLYIGNHLIEVKNSISGSFTIKSGTKTIGGGAFSGCSSITSITIPDSVISIGDDAFRNCSSLTSITIHDSVTSIGNYAFYGCSSLTSITIPNSVTSIGDYAFYYCRALTSITIPNSVTSIGNSAFSGCSKLTSITIPDSVTSIGYYAFKDCRSLTSITIPDSVANIGNSAFSGCSSLKKVNITDLASWCNIDFYNSLSNPLYYAKNLYINGTLAIELTIPNSVTAIKDFAFYNCSSLASITIPDSITSIGNKAFYNTEFYNNSSNWENNVLYIGKHLIQAETSISGSYTIKSGTISISPYAFYNCSKLASITIPDSVTSIGNYAFYYCSSLTSITIPDSVTSIGSNAFYYCSSLTSITIPNSVTNIGNSAFSGCSALTSITIPDSVTSIGWCAFYSCNKLTSITIPDSITSIDSSAFYNCSSLTIVNITDLASWCNIDFSYVDSNPLYYAKNLYINGSLATELTIPNSVTAIKDFAFYNYSSLTSITIPNSVTSIGYSAFDNCRSLTSITIPDSVTSIGEDAFYNCSSLKTVYYCGTEEEWNKISIDSDNSPLTNATRYYHNFVDKSYWDCNNGGYNRLLVCSICGEREYGPTQPIVRHSFVETDRIPPTCTEYGMVIYTCEYCSATDIDYISNLGHSFSDWIIKTSVTCETDGEKYHICDICNEEETEITPSLGHDYAENFTVDLEPTDFSEGSKSRHCSRCESVTDVTVIPKTSIASGVCGDSADWILKPNGALIISGSGATSNYKFPNYAPWYEYSELITEIIVESSITKIGNSNFGEFKNLNKITIENPDCAFGLYVFPEDTSNLTIYSLGSGEVEAFANTEKINLIKPENPYTPSTPVLKCRTDNSVELIAIAGYEYSKDGINWQSSALFKNLLPNCAYSFYQRLAGGVYQPSAKSDALTVTTRSIPNAPTIEKVESNNVTLNAENGVEYSIDGINWQTSGEFKNLTLDTIITFYARKSANGTDGATSKSEPKKCLIASAPKVLVGESCIKAVPKENYEYCIDNMVWQDSNVFTRYIIPEETYTVFCRPKAIDGVEIFYDTNGTTVCINGNNTITNPDATHLVWLKKLLLTESDSINLAADINGDYTIDIRDLVRLKKMLAEQTNESSTPLSQTETNLAYSETAYLSKKTF